MLARASHTLRHDCAWHVAREPGRPTSTISLCVLDDFTVDLYIAAVEARPGKPPCLGLDLMAAGPVRVSVSLIWDEKVLATAVVHR